MTQDNSPGKSVVSFAYIIRARLQTGTLIPVGVINDAGNLDGVLAMLNEHLAVRPTWSNDPGYSEALDAWSLEFPIPSTLAIKLARHIEAFDVESTIWIDTSTQGPTS